MKKTLFFIALFSNLLHVLCLGQPQDPTKLFMGTIQFPQNITNNDICLYYKGQKLVTEWDKQNICAEYSFLESQYAQELYILICDDITCQTADDNTIQHLLIEKNDYCCYKLNGTRAHDVDKKLTGFSWNVENHTIEKGIIPDNTLILLFDPKLIEKLQVHTWNNNQTMRVIPTITIKNNTTLNELVRTMTVTRLKALDIDSIHEKELFKTK